MVCGSPRTETCRKCLVQIEAGNRHVTGTRRPPDRRCFRDRVYLSPNPHRGYITIHRRLRQVLRLLRGALYRGKERSRTSNSVLAEARQMADLGYTEIQLLGQNVNSYKDPAGKKRRSPNYWPLSPRFPRSKRVRFTTSHPRDFGKDIVDAIDAVPSLCDHVHLACAERFPLVCSTPCSASTPASSTSSASLG